MPKGKPHIHSAKFRRCVRKVSARGERYNPYAVCEASIGYKGSIARGHRRMPRKAIEKMLSNPRTPAHLKAYWRKRLKKAV